MTNKQEALIALKKLRPMTGNDTPNEYWFEIAAVISTHMDTIRAALTEAPKVDVERLKREVWEKCFCTGSGTVTYLDAIDYLTTHCDLVKKENT